MHAQNILLCCFMCHQHRLYYPPPAPQTCLTVWNQFLPSIFCKMKVVWRKHKFRKRFKYFRTRPQTHTRILSGSVRFCRLHVVVHVWVLMLGFCVCEGIQTSVCVCVCVCVCVFSKALWQSTDSWWRWIGCRNWTVGDLKGSVDCVYLCVCLCTSPHKCVCVCVYVCVVGGGRGTPADW